MGVISEDIENETLMVLSGGKICGLMNGDHLSTGLVDLGSVVNKKKMV